MIRFQSLVTGRWVFNASRLMECVAPEWAFLNLELPTVGNLVITFCRGTACAVRHPTEVVTMTLITTPSSSKWSSDDLGSRVLHFDLLNLTLVVFCLTYCLLALLWLVITNIACFVLWNYLRTYLRSSIQTWNGLWKTICCGRLALGEYRSLLLINLNHIFLWLAIMHNFGYVCIHVGYFCICILFFFCLD